MGYEPIENYGVIGDMRTAALVGMNGAIDFFCFPRFDSPSLFAALLDDRRGGRFLLAPADERSRRKQLYLPESNVLLSRFLFEEGVAEVSDFMPVGDPAPAQSLIRRAKTVRGRIHYRMRCEPRFDFARTGHRVEQRGPGEVLFIPDGGGAAVRLRTEVPLTIVDGAAVAEFELGAGVHAAFVLEPVGRGGDSPSSAPCYVPDCFKETMNYWHRWISHSTYRGRWRESVHRSALTLKLLTSRELGSMVAAPTFGLPEELGGSRNWDYRFTWIRDASFTLYALIRLGYTEEAEVFMSWIEARCGELAPDGSLQIMYGLDGRHALDEQVLAHLDGYRGSRPVRVGNNAYRQLQLDIYGELMDSVYLYNKFGKPISHDLWKNLMRLVDYVCRNWQRADEGIWEMRGGRREFLLSRVMCWVAIDRAIRLSEKRSFPAPLGEWLRVRDRIYEDIFTRFWNPEKQAFPASLGTTAMDAANLLMPLIKFIAPTDPRWLSTLRSIERELVSDSLVYRYTGRDDPIDGLSGREGTFNMCSFWFVEALARSGDVDLARYFFEKVLGYANHLGLYAEELGSRGEHLGNFPQAFSHLGMISAAYILDKLLNQAGRA
jgi:GH15 family glucan-1,4-alpha-glucosidase